MHGEELWKSDGTAAGTMMVKDINPGGANGIIRYLTNVNGTLFFKAYDAIHGSELWKSDGTVAGTVMVKDIAPGGFPDSMGGYYAKSSNPGSLTNVNGTLYFSASEGDFGGVGTFGRELWKSDGTAAGTTLVKDILPGGAEGYYGGYYPNNSRPFDLTNVNGTLFFTAIDGTHGAFGRSLWKSDGTAAGTVAVSPIESTNLTNVNGMLFFSASDGIRGTELWKSDGTAAGTVMVKDIFPGESPYDYGYGPVLVPNNSSPDDLTVVNGTLFFTANDGADGIHGRSLWKSDGTAAGTMKVANTPVRVLNGLTNVDGTLYFGATDHLRSDGVADGLYGYELWKSDGTAAGTTLVKDLYPGSTSQGIGHPAITNSSYPSSITNVNGTLYFTANDGVNGRELWKSDGTAAGTILVKDIKLGSGSSIPLNFTNANGTLFFTADDGIHGTELWALNTVPAPSLSVGGSPATSTAGSAFSFTVTAKNADESTNTSYLGKVHFTSTDPQAVLPPDYTFTAADQGTHTFTVNLKTAGPQSITATDAQSPALSATTSNLLVKPAVESTMTVSGFPSTTTAGTVESVTVTLKDPYGNVATGYVGTVHFTSSDPQAVLPADYTFTALDAGKHTFSVTLKTAGTQSITAGEILRPTLTGTQGGIAVNAAAASQFLLSAPTSVKAGTAFSLTLTVTDAYGNVVTGYTGRVHFTSTSSSARLPADYTFAAADKGIRSFTGVVLRKKGNPKITVTDTLNSSVTATVVVKVR